MVKTYLVLSLTILMVIPFLALDVYAQTPVSTITAPSFDKQNKPIVLYAESDNRVVLNSISVSGTFYAANHENGHITILSNTAITGLTYGSGTDKGCNKATVSTIGGTHSVLRAKIPIDHTAAMGVKIEPHTWVAYPEQCDDPIAVTFDDKLVLDKEIYVRIYNIVNQNVFYYVNGADTVVQIPKCTNFNFNFADNTLRGDTEACYGKDGRATIIVSKVLAIFGTTTQEIIPIETMPPQENFEDIEPKFTAFGIIPLGAGKGGEIRVYDDARFGPPNSKGDVLIQANTKVEPATLFETDIGKPCITVNFRDPSLLQTPPTVILGADAMGFDLSTTDGATYFSCTVDPSTFNGSILTDKEMRITLYPNATTYDIIPYFFSQPPGNSATKPIPPCKTGTNIDAQQNLMDDTEMCYGKHNDNTVIISKRIGIYSANAPLEPIAPDPTLTVPGITDESRIAYTYRDYSNMINTSTLTVQDGDIMEQYLSMPRCDKKRVQLSYTASMNSNQDVVLKFSTYKKDFDGKAFVIIKNDAGISSISLPSTLVEQTGFYRYYSVTISNDLLGDNNVVRLIPFLYETSDIIHNKRVYSTSSSGSPLYYNVAPKFFNMSDNGLIQMPDADSSVNFVPGKVHNVDGTVYVPKGNNVQLTGDVLCQFAVFKSKQVAKIFDMNIFAENATSGLQFTYTFEKKKFASGDGAVKTSQPSIIHWIVTDSDNNVTRGSTTNVGSTHVFTIPLESGDYNIVMYGKRASGGLIGTHADSYTFSSQ